MVAHKPDSRPDRTRRQSPEDAAPGDSSRLHVYGWEWLTRSSSTRFASGRTRLHWISIQNQIDHRHVEQQRAAERAPPELRDDIGRSVKFVAGETQPHIAAISHFIASNDSQRR
jgi:hypothetical protein